MRYMVISKTLLLSPTTIDFARLTYYAQTIGGEFCYAKDWTQMLQTYVAIAILLRLQRKESSYLEDEEPVCL